MTPSPREIASGRLYYFGARYYDPRTSVWQSPDPILGKYLPSGNKKQDAQLPGIGGVFNTLNLNLYTYGDQNPLRYIDPDGNEDIENTANNSNQDRQARMVATGAVLGGTAAAVAAGACTAGTGGVCGLGAPAIIAGGTALGAVAGGAVDKAWTQLERLVSKATDAGPRAVQYALLAETSGLYPTVRGDLVQLNAGEVWKYGVSTDPANRYPLAGMQGLSLQMEIQATGSLSQVLVAEKVQLIQHFMTNGSLPPGNRIFK